MKNFTRILLSVAVLILMSLNIYAAQPPVAGSKPISNRAELDAMRNICPRTDTNGNFHLVNDIDLSDGAWTPIQGAGSVFTGIFDGQGFVIRNMTVTRGNLNNNAGLFAEICSDSVIKNVGLEDANVSINIDSGTVLLVGGMVGINNGTITNSYVTGSVSGESTRVDAYAGGIAGRNRGIILDCYSTASVAVSSRSSAAAGGIVGENDSSNALSAIRNTYSTGFVNVRRGRALGGVIGINRDSGVVSNSFWNTDTRHERIGSEIPADEKVGIGQGEGDAKEISTTGMHATSFLNDLNTNNAWEFVSAVNEGFPVLRVFRHQPIAPVDTPPPFVMPPAGEHINVVINNQIHVFDVPPQLINGRTMLPLRAISEALGMTVGFDPDTNTATLTAPNLEILHVIHTNRVTVNGTTQTFDASSTIMDGRTLVPVRMLAEAIGADVDWHAESRTAIITTN